MLPIVPQAADDIDDGDAALTAFDTMHSGWMAAYRDHPVASGDESPSGRRFLAPV